MFDRRLVGIVFVLLGGPALGLADASFASANDVRCAQAYLDFKGFDPGPIDGSFGRRTAAAASHYMEATGTDVGELTKPTADVWCSRARDDKAFAGLLDFSYGTAGLWRRGATSNRDYNQVLVGDSVGKFQASDRNIRNKAALGFVELDGGAVAARILVRYEDEGHRDDWYWNDKPGVQQRFELAERRSFSMKPGKTYWLRMSVFIPRNVVVSRLDQLVLTDLKPWVGRRLFDPVLNIKLGDRYFQVDHLIGRQHECVHGFSEGGAENTVCDSSKEQLFIKPIAEVQDRWVNLVYRFHWANDDTGRFHLWMDDELMMGLAGDSLHGADFVANKFGIYRGFYGSQGEPQPKANIYFAGVGRSETCGGLGLDTCDALEADVERIETPGVIGRNYVNDNSMSEYLAAGGRTMH